MRKALLAVVTLSTLALPGCIFAVGGHRGDWDDNAMSSECCQNCAQMQRVEKRLSVIERHLRGECKPDCPFCKKPDAAEGKAADGKAAEKTGAAPAGK